LCSVARGDPRSLEPLLAEAARGDRLSAARAFPSSALAGGRLRVLVRLAPGVKPEVALAGFERGLAAGPIVPVRVAPDQLAALQRRPGVVLVEASRTLRPQLDRSAPKSGAVAVREELGLDGSGALVGIVDTGLDFRHADFQDAKGATRVRYLLDFSLEASNSQGSQGIETYGARLFDARDLDNQLSLERTQGSAAPLLVPHEDTYGHGTHITGIAAGTGAAAGKDHPRFRYVGMAPGASIIAVKATRGDGINFSDADVIHGVQFVFDRARALKMPAVANISLGTQLGPHDGTSNLATALSALTGPQKPGRIIVAAVGNDGGQDLHAVGHPATDGPSEVVLEIPPYKPSTGRELVHLEIWYDAHLSVTLTSPGGRSLGPVATGERLEQLTPEGLVKVLNAPGGPYKPNGRNMVVLIVDEREQVHPRSGRWVVGLAGAAPRYDAWLVNPGIQSEMGRPRLLGPLDPDTKINSPATATGVLSVAAYSLRSAWRSVDGPVGVATVQPEEHAFFSATGPTLDGRFIPDVSAPGEFIVSALSSHASPLSATSAFHTEGLPGALWHTDRTRGLLRGTSQAAPHVAGAVALLLSRRPDLTLPEVRELLRSGARVDRHVGAGQAWSPRWGFGKLDARRALAVLDGDSPGPLDLKTSGVSVNRDLVPPGSTGGAVVTVIPRDSVGLPLGPGHNVTISTSAGRLDPPVHIAFGRFEARFHAEGCMGEIARITAHVDGVELPHHPRIHLSTRRALVGSPFHARGGCGVCFNGHTDSGLLLFLVLVAVSLAASRSRQTNRHE
jgi:subtilisin family serine protease